MILRLLGIRTMIMHCKPNEQEPQVDIYGTRTRKVQRTQSLPDLSSSSEQQTSSETSSMSPQRVLIYLMRRDLRIADNPVFHEITKAFRQNRCSFSHVLPVYVFPAQQVEVSGFLNKGSISPFAEARSETGGFWRCGTHRAKFLAESVWDLKSDLERLESGLAVRVGMLGQVVQDLISAFQQTGEIETAAVWMTCEEGIEEKREERDVKKVAETESVDFRLWRDEKYFIDDRDVPFDDPRDLPDVFTTYRKAVEPLRDAPRNVLSPPKSLPPLPTYIPDQSSPFSIPSTYDDVLASLLSPLEAHPDIRSPSPYPSGTKSAHPFHGGAKMGHRRIQHLIASGSMTGYKDSRNGLLGEDFSTKLSAWLALGCITARQIHFQLIDFEDAKNDQWRGTRGYGKGENAGTAAVRFELLWRDYMRLCTRKFGPRLFRVTGFRGDDSYPWKTPGKRSPEVEDMVHRFLTGTTGTGLIDASQRELLHTGYTSNRARQNVASFLAKHLGVNWKIGAEWYESQLTDYDVSSNWGNWQYVAGVGNDPRGEARVFNPIKQACDYDAHGDYVRSWIEEVREVEDAQKVFQPWKLSGEERAKFHLEGLDWVERPLVKIDFKVGSGKRGGGGGGGGKYGGSSRGKSNGAGEGGKGRGGGRFGDRGGGGVAFRGRGRGNHSRMGFMDKANGSYGNGVY